MNKKYFRLSVISAAFALGTAHLQSCRSFIEVEPPVTNVSTPVVYADDNSAISVLTYVYGNMSGNFLGDGTISSLSLLPELLADNLVNHNTSSDTKMAYYRNLLGFSEMRVSPDYWYRMYNYIYTTNAVIEGVSASPALTPSVKQQLLGEAKFMRAFCYYYLVNLYGGVPLVLSTNYAENSRKGRNTEQEVYKQIVEDLKDAKEGLNTSFMAVSLKEATNERIRPNKWAAAALLARVYLFMGDHVNAEAQATEVIDQTTHFQLLPLNDVFKKNSRETIWSLQTVFTAQNTWQGRAFILPATGPGDYYDYSLSGMLMNSYETGDNRVGVWIGKVTANGKDYYYPWKYKVEYTTGEMLEYDVVLRLAEQYLIRAEARAKRDNLTGANSASSDLNAIRQRAGLLPTTATSQAALLDAILQERRHELFTEWAHRWLDLKRTGKIDAVMSAACAVKGGNWEPYKAFLPVPQSEINKNPGMRGQQTPGYTN